MSRSNNTEIVNPAKKFFEYSGSKGIFKYYDREEKKDFEVALPFRFLVLDTLSTITGWSNADESGFWSNEVRNLKDETLIVKTKSGVFAEGLYSEIKDKIGNAGAKYTQSVYIAYYEGDVLTLGHVKFFGSSLNSWINFRKNGKIFEGAIQVKDTEEAKNGATVYQIPNFTKTEVTEETNTKAVELDKELQVYLKAYFERMGVVAEKETAREVVEEVKQVADEPVTPIDEGGNDLPQGNRDTTPLEDMTPDDLPF